MNDEALRLQPGQRELTSEQQAEAARFVTERIQTQLSTDPVNEPAVEALLAQAYVAAGLAPPTDIFWLDGPLELVAAWTPPGVLDHIKRRLDRKVLASITPLAESAQWNGSSVWFRDASTIVWPQVLEQVRSEVLQIIEAQGMADLKESVATHINDPIETAISSAVRSLIFLAVDAVTAKHTRKEAYATYGIETVSSSVSGVVRESVWCYEDAPYRAYYAYFEAYYAPNALHALDQVGQQVSGYWLGRTIALLVRRPRLLLRDGGEQLHSATGKCVEYRDGWGIYAWHGVAVPRKVIVKPEALTREDFFRQRDIETRRVIQERMGERFVMALGGAVIDAGTQGVLYEVALPHDPDRIACYVHVHDPSSQREYHLRVPPTMTSAAEAVAWTFGLSVEEYRPLQQT